MPDPITAHGRQSARQAFCREIACIAQMRPIPTDVARSAVYMCLCGHTGEFCKTDERIEMLFGGRLMWVQEIIGWGAQRRYLANTIERSVRGGDAALHQTTLTTCRQTMI